MTASTRNPAALGSIGDLRRRAQALAVLDLCLQATPEHKFEQAEGLFDDVELAGRSNGQGDDVLLVFTAEGALVRGFDHESPMTPYDPDVALMHLSDDELEEMDLGEQLRIQDELRPFTGVLDPLPESMRELLRRLDREPTRPVAIPSVLTFCLWRPHDADAWRVGEIAFPERDDPDGSEYLLAHYCCDAAAYKEWVDGYLERAVPVDLIEALFAHQPLTQALVNLVPPARGEDPPEPRGLDELLVAAAAIGYGV